VESAVIVVVVLIAWFALNRWLLPRFGIRT
jgi:hypothetical protein